MTPPKRPREEMSIPERAVTVLKRLRSYLTCRHGNKKSPVGQCRVAGTDFELCPCSQCDIAREIDSITTEIEA